MSGGIYHCTGIYFFKSAKKPYAVEFTPASMIVFLQQEMLI